MKDKILIDSNVWIYLASKQDVRKKKIAGELISTGIVADCKILYTEDLQHNQLIEKKLRIINPFKKEL
ncbi:MAG: hypothetical protein K8R58_05325 [Bacteroidales bacterium]|nr:hypothetical protein [Bacteroidales bacterium]